jgi:type VI secretion system protein
MRRRRITRLKRGRALRASLSACALLALTLLLSGCPKGPKVVTKRLPGGPKDGKLDLRFSVSPQANGGNPVALDILLVSDKELLKELQKMSASDWFAKREQIILDHPKEEDLVVLRREWVPGQVVEPSRITVKPEIRAGLVFANYFGPGEHRAVLDPRARDVQINLEETKLEVVARKK